MQVSSAQSSSSWSSLANFARPAAGEGKATPAADALPIAANDQETVDVHALDASGKPAVANQQTTAEAQSEVFAEIWKDGMKIGAVYTDGQAELAGAYGGTTLGSGALYAQMRAEDISRQVGGEVRFVNLPALQVAQVRAQLRTAYGV